MDSGSKCERKIESWGHPAANARIGCGVRGSHASNITIPGPRESNRITPLMPTRAHLDTVANGQKQHPHFVPDSACLATFRMAFYAEPRTQWGVNAARIGNSVQMRPDFALRKGFQLTFPAGNRCFSGVPLAGWDKARPARWHGAGVHESRAALARSANNSPAP